MIGVLCQMSAETTQQIRSLAYSGFKLILGSVQTVLGLLTAAVTAARRWGSTDYASARTSLESIRCFSNDNLLIQEH